MNMGFTYLHLPTYIDVDVDVDVDYIDHPLSYSKRFLVFGFVVGFFHGNT
jgi:hypothetical protein